MSAFEIEEWMIILDRNAIKSIAQAKGQTVSLYFLQLQHNCNCMWGFQFPSRICPGLFSFYGGFFLHTVKDMSSFEVEEWMFVLAIKSIARAKGQRVSLYFLQMHFFKCVKICAVGALTEYHYNFFCPLVVNLRSLQGRVRKVLVVWHMCTYLNDK